MNLQNTAISVLDQLKAVISQMDKDCYAKTIPSHEASVGEHTRHTIEFYQCLYKGLKSGRVNYDKRNRNLEIQLSPEPAIEAINDLMIQINKAEADAQLILEINYDLTDESTNKINSSYKRELAYNIEHAIHHMAIIKSIIVENFRNIRLPENFGIAISTVKYRNKALN